MTDSAVPVMQLETATGTEENPYKQLHIDIYSAFNTTTKKVAVIAVLPTKMIRVVEEAPDNQTLAAILNVLAQIVAQIRIDTDQRPEGKRAKQITLTIHRYKNGNLHTILEKIVKVLRMLELVEQTEHETVVMRSFIGPNYKKPKCYRQITSLTAELAVLAYLTRVKVEQAATDDEYMRLAYAYTQKEPQTEMHPS